MNKKFQVGDKVICNWGGNKGIVFLVEVILKNGYSCKRFDIVDGKYYSYNDNQLEPIIC